MIKYHNKKLFRGEKINFVWKFLMGTVQHGESMRSASYEKAERKQGARPQGKNLNLSPVTYFLRQTSGKIPYLLRIATILRPVVHSHDPVENTFYSTYKMWVPGFKLRFSGFQSLKLVIILLPEPLFCPQSSIFKGRYDLDPGNGQWLYMLLECNSKK